MRPRRPSGPTWPRSARTTPDDELVESILEPSKVIKKGYEPVTIATDDGRTITGLLAEERPDAVVLRDPAQDGKPITIARDRIEQRRKGGPSLMPAGLVNALASRQQFLDLVRYLMEIAEHGPARARALRPDPALVVAPAARVRAPARPRRADRRPGAGQPPPRRGHLYPRLRQLPRHQGPARLAAQRPAVRLRRAQERQRPLQPVSHHHRRLRPDGAAVLDGPAAEVRRHPLHPRDVPQAAQPGPVRRGQPSVPRPAAQGDHPRPRAVGDRALGRDGLRLVPDGDRSRSATTCSNVAYKGIAVRLDPGQGGVSRGPRLGRSTTTTRSAWPPPGPARASSTGTASTSTASTRSIPGPSARSTSPTPTVPAGPTRTTRAPRTVASSGATAGATARCRPTGRTTGASTATATAWSSPTPSARPTSSRCPASRPTPPSPASRSSPGPWRSAPRPSSCRCGWPRREVAVGPRRRSCRGEPVASRRVDRAEHRRRPDRRGSSRC